MFQKLAKMPCAVSGRRYASESASRIAPQCVSNMRLNILGSVREPGVLASGPTVIPRSAAESAENGQVATSVSWSVRLQYLSSAFRARARLSSSPDTYA